VKGSVRPPAAAGSFYPADPRLLDEALDAAFSAARAPVAPEPVPKALVVPHAGYVYSGPVAASAYLRVAPARGRLRRVVLAGPSHFVALSGLAVAAVDALATPFGPLPVDRDGRELLARLDGVRVDDAPHALDHALEVQLPFLWRVLGEVAVLPVAVGAGPDEQAAAALEAVFGGPETLVVVSTDLSHYHDHDTASRLDAETAAAVVAGDAARIGPYDACGAFALRALLVAARRRGLAARLLDLRTSGDTAGDRSRVVGYGAFALH
jgi:AmmeMemoRadiSam system protein B